MKGNKFGLTIQKKPEEDKQTLQPSSVFDTNSDDDNLEKETNDEKFQRKYAVPTKLKDKKILEKAIAEDPTIFDYDSQYEEMQKVRDQKIIEQKEADKEKKPKYAHKLIETHKRRELEKLLHDERTYKKEREKEAGEFDDKEVFITGEYRKQIEERESFRKELEELDKMDEIRDVKNQKLWQQAFHRKILEDRARVYPDTSNNSQKEENNIKEEENEEKIIIKNKKENEEIIKEEIEEMEKEVKIKENCRENEDKYERGRERSNSPKKFKRISDDSKSEKNGKSLPSFIPSIDDEMNEEIHRMEKIRQILRRRNDENAVAEARLRYFERREQGEIVPPF
uniref:Nuclear speckle splicing regulatory protein 1 N-terminal domain-containing protein n=1 Tax=Meloidogyne incognita TaxID=6306 RepID=A0A914MUL2_MELIC